MDRLGKYTPEVLPLGLEVDAAQARLGELRSLPIVYQAPFEDLVDQVLRENDGTDGSIVPGFYGEKYLGKLIVSNSDQLKSRDTAGVIASVRALEARRESILRLNDSRVLVITQDDEERQRTWDIADAVNKLVHHIQGGPGRATYATGLSWSRCHDIAKAQGLWPAKVRDEALFTRLLESHQQVIPTHEDLGIAAIAARQEVEPYTIGETLDRVYSGLDIAVVRSGSNLLSGLVIPEGLPAKLQGDVAEAMRLDTRLGYLGFNGINEYFMPPSEDLPDPHGVRAVVQAAKATGDMLAMRDLNSPNRLRRDEALLLAQREGLLDDVSPEQQGLFDRLLYLHPALTRRNTGSKPLAPQLSEYADIYRERVLFSHISAERQNEIFTEFYVSFGEAVTRSTVDQTLTREEVLQTFERGCGLKMTDYDFIEKCILPRIFGWRQRGLEEYAGRQRHVERTRALGWKH